MFPIAGDGEPLSQTLRQPDEAVAYWYGGAFYPAPERASWLFRYLVERISAPLKLETNAYPRQIFLKLFYPRSCALPAGADWDRLSNAVHR